MGYWSMSVHGTGQHDNNGHEHDAGSLFKEFVAKLKEHGHLITAAHFTAGSQQQVTPDPVVLSNFTPTTMSVSHEGSQVQHVAKENA